ncbi:branched-chain amino acid ABC transporter ATP-binding protein/permease [Variovorax sp. PBL-E5]|uniref:branched-chain amino acid ABC transporter ATP-binding protein/permease n=1 Tax=Variovorax sp. PBL-E5 TaxID=434014 RepID=UPI00131937A0|nr:branched-chain amino acid ABC transporter ATP-binding protein/permease [Variovorax sp. PBL-E5]VTU39959.1 Glutamine transport ATP-binding protein GlnQ [Variovorax sp. PBL-E5]
MDSSIASASPRPVSQFPLPPWIMVISALLVLAGIGAALWNSYYLLLMTFAAIYVLAAVGLNLLTGYAGIVSIAHGALVCVGTYATAIATVHYGWNFWPAMLLSAAVGLVFSTLLALPALRLSSWYFVLITIAFSLAVTAMLNDLRSFTGGYGGIVGVAKPSVLGLKLDGFGLFALVLAAVALLCWVTHNIIDSRLGWALRSIREGDVRARANGVSTARLRLFAFAMSGAIAGLAGAFYASAKGVVTPEDFSFDFSIFFLFVVVLGGPARLAGPLLGVAAFYVLPEMLGSLKEYRMIAYGVGLLVFSVFLPEGLAGAIAALDERRAARRAAARVGQRCAGPSAATTPRDPVAAPAERVTGVGIEVRDLVKQFEGVRALDGVSLDVRPGSIHVIVGPNGSGKTTLLNMISGFYPCTSGSIRLDGTEITGRGPTSIARMRVQRTFQTPKLLGELTLLENVRFGGYVREQSTGLELALRLPRARREAANLDAEALRWLALVGLADRAHERAAGLPHGQQRLVEIARALIGQPMLLLLDEPAAGLSMNELDELGDLMRAIRQMGTTLIMVEHHIELVADVADSVTVLDQGRILAEGTAEEVFNSAEVVRAYTGAKK